MAYPTFGEIAEKLGIPRCRGIRPNGQICHGFDHRRGQVGDGFVHWADRSRIERAGVRRFLKMAAIMKLDEEGETRSWARLYLAQTMINNWSPIIGISFPGVLTDVDKIIVRAMLINVPTGDPMRDAAMRWAQS